MRTPGIHHVTAITDDAQKNIDFYTGVLGLRLVKLTVNFDDPRAYHLYYGNASGQPGTALTFFAWPGVPKGRHGFAQASTIAFSIPRASLDFWEARLKEKGTAAFRSERFGVPLLTFDDPDGLSLELAAEEPLAAVEPWPRTVAAEHAIRAFHGVTLCEDGSERTRQFLTAHFGYAADGEDGTTFRYRAGDAEPGRFLHVRAAPDMPQGIMGAGTIHHVAFRALNDADEVADREELLTSGFDATPVIDRLYFHSVYFREPGGILFEIATDNPGFSADEPLEKLGTSLRLPPWYEPMRAQIEQALPRVTLPNYE